MELLSSGEKIFFQISKGVLETRKRKREKSGRLYQQMKTAVKTASVVDKEAIRGHDNMKQA